MIYKVRIFSNFCRSEDCKDIYERLCEYTSPIYDYSNITLTNDDDYDHVIILNTAMPTLKADVPKENVVGLAFEPPKYLRITTQFVEYAVKHIGKYCIGDATGLPEPFTERYSHMWHNPSLNSPPKKDKLMSIMVSDKKDARGHLYRHELVKKILESNLPIDIYGRGCRLYSFMGMRDERVKGEFNETEPYQQYAFHICIENFQLNEYFSEKIVNPLLCSTTPIYWGCRNIHNHFPEKVIMLTGDISKDMSLLNDICTYPGKYRKEINVEEVKRVIYLFQNMDNLFR